MIMGSSNSVTIFTATTVCPAYNASRPTQLRSAASHPANHRNYNSKYHTQNSNHNQNLNHKYKHKRKQLMQRPKDLSGGIVYNIEQECVWGRRGGIDVACKPNCY